MKKVSLFVFLLIGIFAVVSMATYTIAFVPKLVGIPYFTAMQEGGTAAASALGVNFIYTGPTTASVEGQIQVISSLITQGVNAIAVSANDPVSLVPIMQKAMSKGILAMAADSDVATPGRKIFVEQATSKGLGYALMDETAKYLGGKGYFAIISGGETATNLNEWIMYLKEDLKNYPDIHLATIRYAGESISGAEQDSAEVMEAFPQVKVLVGMNSTASPGAAAAIELLHKVGQVVTIGITDPILMKQYMKDGVSPACVLWNPKDLGYLTVWAAVQLLQGKTLPANTPIDVPGISEKPTYDPQTGVLLLGAPLVFTPQTVDQYNF
uniref:Autoinducer 2 ABC transporter substrate-binding protein n=1 Tax=Thermodesulfobium narugense TaxID=184064 RepID=A0A7C5KD17_9BACT